MFKQTMQGIGIIGILFQSPVVIVGWAIADLLAIDPVSQPIDAVSVLVVTGELESEILVELPESLAAVARPLLLALAASHVALLALIMT
nr:hypothetical protein [Halomonas ethanolica]